MSKLINEDWEHAAYVNDELYRAEREHRMMIEYEQWEYEQKIKNKKPAIIKLENPTNETAHKSQNIQRNNKEEL